MTAPAKTTTLAAALAAAQAKMPRVEKDGTNPHFKSRFTTLDHLIAKTRPVLNEHGLSLVQMPATNELGAPVLRTILLHESGEQITADCPLFLGGQDMQKFGSAVTYARRYAWASALGIADAEDDDGASARSEKKEAAKPVAAKAAPPPDTQALEDELLALNDQWAGLDPSYNAGDLIAWMDGLRGKPTFAAEVAATLNTYRGLVAAKQAEADAKPKSEFQIPDKAKAAA